MSSLRILLVGTQMATGGAQKVLLDQAGWFHARGYKTTAVFFYDRENLHARWQSNAAFPIINLNAFRKGAGVVANGFSMRQAMPAPSKTSPMSACVTEGDATVTASTCPISSLTSPKHAQPKRSAAAFPRAASESTTPTRSTERSWL